MDRAKPMFVLMAVAFVSVGISQFSGASLCPLYRLAGIPCPSCGMTRAWVSFLSGNIELAFLYHPLFFAVLALALIPFVAKWEWVGKAYIGLGMAFVLVWVVRLVLYFPHTVPMVFDDSALIPVLFDKMMQFLG